MKISAIILLTCLTFPNTALADAKNLPGAAPIRFILIGDTGTGKPEQYSVAKAIEKVCSEAQCQFAVNAGDNIYEYGVTSSQDEQFQSKFEKPYASLPFPFFMALGNHDQSGTVAGSGVHPDRGDFEVQYTKKSLKWMMPERYYRFAAPFSKPDDYRSGIKNPLIEFFVIDSNYLAPQNKPENEWYKPGQDYDKSQKQWLRQSISSSKANWKVVVAHHPYRNNGKHGNAGEYFGFGLSRGTELKKMYEEEVCGKVDLLVTGHDHSLQWLKPYNRCGSRPQFLISGAGAKTNGPNMRPDRKNAAIWESFHKLGFFWVEASAKELRIRAYTVSENSTPVLRHEGVIPK